MKLYNNAGSPTELAKIEVQDENPKAMGRTGNTVYLSMFELGAGAYNPYAGSIGLNDVEVVALRDKLTAIIDALDLKAPPPPAIEMKLSYERTSNL